MENTIFIDDNTILLKCNEIDKHTEKLEDYVDNYINSRIVDNSVKDLFENHVIPILEYWTRCTYVGERKDKRVQASFNLFFDALYRVLLVLRRSSNMKVSDFANKALYQKGTLYRYLGNLKSIKDVKYNTAWESWSKNKDNTYLKGKLTGKKILLTCKIDVDNFHGLDLTAFGISCNNEEEVVYYTVKETIQSIEEID